ncbi:2-(1,2-epoxy-1,2-dihydrophenyl)acetyl-CoA isomerase [Nitriliruptoraceae bacterium ZYF776]|nr:2-(1,2-epoxy-1,2-dihydrophenyl)acetyl-CoA isomerase [Profundirhabdus halotolerans]
MAELGTARDGGVATLTLRRPERRNAFTGALHDELRAALDEVAADAEVRAVVLTGEGKGFCAGQDLADPEVAVGADLGGAVERWNGLVRALRDLPQPVVAAVNGVAAGAGANLAFACDLVVAARSARFLQPFAQLGLVPDTGGTWTLPRLVGPQRAAGLCLLGEPLGAEDAQRAGLVWQVVDDGEVVAAATAIAARLAALPPQGLRATKRALSASLANDLDTQLDLERDLQRAAGAGAEYRDAVTAFLAR